MALPGAAQPSPQVVGAAFVQQYYIVLHRSPDLVHRFYLESSILSRPDSNGVMTSVTTVETIHNPVLTLDFSNCNIEIESADSQASYKDGVLVVVTGSLTGRDNDIRRKFTQSFFLAPQEGGGYFVLNDIFKFVDLGQPMEANQVLVNANEPDHDDNDEVVNPMENIASAGENAVSADPEINLGHSDHQLISEATASVSQVAEPKKSYASIKQEKKKQRGTVDFERKK